MEFREHVRAIASGYLKARTEKFGSHALARQIRMAWPLSMRELLPESTKAKFLFDASPGLGQWSDAPWLAVLHPAITSSAMAGFYPVYLFEPEFKTVCLVLGQGAQALRSAVGRKAALVELERRASLLREVAVGWREEGFNEGPFITLKSVSRTGASGVKDDPWSVAVAFGKRYLIDSLPSSADMASDLSAMLQIYEPLSQNSKLNFVAIDVAVADLKDRGELPPGGVDGALKLMEHCQVERRQRNRKLVAQVKAQHEAVCFACGFSFSASYGSYMDGFIEAHHSVPLSALPSAGAVLSTDDFMLLCSNCHRAIHRAGCPDLSTFKALLSR
jgi:5-methylcytosine-specific restriction protein A